MKALHEFGVRFDSIFGTSIGALNATMIAQGDVSRLEDLWLSAKASDIFRLPSPAHVRQIVLGHKLGILDTSPLENIVRREASLKKIKASSTRIAFFTTDLHTLETRMVTSENILTTEELVEGLMATCAIPILFPPRRLGGQGQWIDAGLVYNTPIRAAIRSGAEEVFVVLLYPEKNAGGMRNLVQVAARCVDVALHASAHKELEIFQAHSHRLDADLHLPATGSVTLRVVQAEDLGNHHLLEIGPKRSQRLIQRGYEDAIHQLSSFCCPSKVLEASPVSPAG